jgi:hypothetical protein
MLRLVNKLIGGNMKGYTKIEKELKANGYEINFTNSYGLMDLEATNGDNVVRVCQFVGNNGNTPIGYSVVYMNKKKGVYLHDTSNGVSQVWIITMLRKYHAIS